MVFGRWLTNLFGSQNENQVQFMSVESRAYQYLTRIGGFFSILNCLLYIAIYRYSSHPNPGFACIQLSMPLFIWEMLIIIAFCPTDILEHYLGDIILELDGNLMEQDPQFQRLFALRQLQPVHSCGDVVRGNRRIVLPNTDTDSEFVTASIRSVVE